VLEPLAEADEDIPLPPPSFPALKQAWGSPAQIFKKSGQITGQNGLRSNVSTVLRAACGTGRMGRFAFKHIFAFKRDFGFQIFTLKFSGTTIRSTKNVVKHIVKRLSPDWCTNIS
jgi:hypothetical protein